MEREHEVLRSTQGLTMVPVGGNPHRLNDHPSGAASRQWIAGTRQAEQPVSVHQEPTVTADM